MQEVPQSRGVRVAQSKALDVTRICLSHTSVIEESALHDERTGHGKTRESEAIQIPPGAGGYPFLATAEPPRTEGLPQSRPRQ